MHKIRVLDLEEYFVVSTWERSNSKPLALCKVSVDTHTQPPKIFLANDNKW